MKSVFKKSNAHIAYNDVMKRLSNDNYANFYSQCKNMKKSDDPETRAKGKALEKSYRLFQNNGVPFNVAQTIYPELCRIQGDYCVEIAKIKEAAGKHNE